MSKESPHKVKNTSICVSQEKVNQYVCVYQMYSQGKENKCVCVFVCVHLLDVFSYIDVFSVYLLK